MQAIRCELPDPIPLQLGKPKIGAVDAEVVFALHRVATVSQDDNGLALGTSGGFISRRVL